MAVTDMEKTASGGANRGMAGILGGMAVQGTANFPNGSACERIPLWERDRLAGDGFKSTAIFLQPRVIVDDHREQARSYRGSASA